MRFRGGGVGHTGTRAATNKFLQDRHQLDVQDDDHDEDEASEAESRGSNEDNGGDVSGNEDSVGLGLGGEVGMVDHNERLGGGDSDLEEDDEIGGDLEEDYGYSVNDRDEDPDEDSDSQPDLADDLLGPEDGEGEADEANLLGFADF